MSYHTDIVLSKPLVFIGACLGNGERTRFYCHDGYKVDDWDIHDLHELACLKIPDDGELYLLRGDKENPCFAWLIYAERAPIEMNV